MGSLPYIASWVIVLDVVIWDYSRHISPRWHHEFVYGNGSNVEVRRGHHLNQSRHAGAFFLDEVLHYNQGFLCGIDYQHSEWFSLLSCPPQYVISRLPLIHICRTKGPKGSTKCLLLPMGLVLFGFALLEYSFLVTEFGWPLVR